MIKSLTIAALAAVLALASFDADARRFGGGRAVGAQRDAVTQQRQAVPPKSAPNNTANPNAAAGGTAAAGAAARGAGASRWMGTAAMIAGALGLGWLLSQMGPGAFLGMIAFAALALFALAFMARNAMRKSALGPNAGAGAQGNFGGQQRSHAPAAAFEGNNPFAGAPAAAAAHSSLADGFGIPAGFDKPGFEENAKKQFLLLQAANDRGDLDAVRDFTTDALYNEIARDVINGNKDATEIEQLHAELLGIETERGQYWASVRFSGLVREDGMVMSSPFSEVWNLTKPVDGSKGWLLAGIQLEP